MHRFIFISHATSKLDASALSDIARIAMANNERDDLTGILIWAQDAFIELLEGPQTELDATIARIENDTRHSGMITLSRRPISDRLYSDWAMGCHGMRSETATPFFDAPDADTIFQRLSTARDLEFDIFMRNFYDCNVSKGSSRLR